MKHVFVETNWVFDFCAPAHGRKPEAEALAERAEAGELTLYLPGVALREGAETVRRKCQPRAEELKEFRRWAATNGKLTREVAANAGTFLDVYVNQVRADLAALPRRIDEIRSLVGVEVFGLSEPMIERAIDLRHQVEPLRPFDEAILAAVLVRATELEGEKYFCTLDADLVPVDGRGRLRGDLARLYDAAGIVVRQDFLVPS